MDWSSRFEPKVGCLSSVDQVDVFVRHLLVGFGMGWDPGCKFLGWWCASGGLLAWCFGFCCRLGVGWAVVMGGRRGREDWGFL